MPEHEHQASHTLARDHALLCQAVRKAGALALEYFNPGLRHWEKTKGDPVSEADLAVNALLSEQLQGARPAYGWLSEETEDNAERQNKALTWVVDPIDGTRAFIKGKPDFTICVALVQQGRPVASAVFNPARNEFYDATLGGGARLNGELVIVSPCKQIAGCSMMAFAPLFRHPSWPETWPDMRISAPNSIAYRLALVAKGTADAALTLNSKNDWDLAAADLLVHEAGGRLTTHDGHPLTYNKACTKHPSLIAAGPFLHEILLRKLRAITLS